MSRGNNEQIQNRTILYNTVGLPQWHASSKALIPEHSITYQTATATGDQVKNTQTYRGHSSLKPSYSLLRDYSKERFYYYEK